MKILKKCIINIFCRKNFFLQIQFKKNCGCNINQYINEGKTLMISYADNNGGVSNRIIDPISISLGTLTARDEASDEIVQFRIPRINGVAPALTVLGNKADLDL
jgi:hypothetical protein